MFVVSTARETAEVERAGRGGGVEASPSAAHGERVHCARPVTLSGVQGQGDGPTTAEDQGIGQREGRAEEIVQVMYICRARIWVKY